jgi:hypothetical protein
VKGEETGEIVDPEPERLEPHVDGLDERRVVYEREDRWHLQLTYAITNQRAQGSEWPNAVVVVSQSHYLKLQRNLVYTALTRAKQRAVIVVNGRLSNRQTGAMYRSALTAAVANDPDRPALRWPGGAARECDRCAAVEPRRETPITTAIADSELAPTSCPLTGVRAEVWCTFATRFGTR